MCTFINILNNLKCLFIDIAIQFNLTFADPPRKFSDNAKLIGGKLFEKFIKLLGQHEISDEVEYFINKDQQEENVSWENMPSTSQSTLDEEYEPPEKVSVLETVPYDVKLKIVMTVREHPQ